MRIHRLRERRAGAAHEDAVARAVGAFDAHLRDTCGLADATRIYRRRYVGAFLRCVFGDGAVDARRLTSADVARAVPRVAPGVSAASAGVVASSLRSWLRFQQLVGACDGRLVAAIPATWSARLAALPVGLSDEEVDRLLASFDRATPAGLRDYAICRCLLDLGLRTGEASALTLDDIDWPRGVLHLRPGKARRADAMPFPAATARAVAAYLRDGRPPSATRALFVRHRCPKGGRPDSSVIRSAIRRAAERVGLRGRSAGPHALRRTAATRLLRAGATLKDVADVLRHRSLDTTALYAKVDRKTLDRIALPWPGSAS